MSKNTRTRILLVAVASLLLVTMAVGGTVAWLQDKTNVVTNTFSTTNVDIQLEESTGTTYEMVPGATIKKDPVVTVIKQSEACWLFVEIVETNNTFSKDGVETAILTYADDMKTQGWTKLDDENVWYRSVAKDDSKNQEFKVFENVVVDAGVTNEVMDAHEGNNQPKLAITAYAIQSEHLTVTAPADVWALVKNATVYATPTDSAEGTLYVDAQAAGTP